MAQAPRTFCLDFDRKKLYANPFFETDYSLASFFNGDTERFLIYLVSKGPQAGTLTKTSTTGLTLKIGVGIKGSPSTVYTSVTLTAGADYFTGDLPFNVAAVAALFTSQSGDVSVVIEFELTDGGYSQTIQVEGRISQQIITTTLIDTPAPDTAIGIQAAIATFVPQTSSPAIPSLQILTDTNGSGQRYLFCITNGVPRFDPIP